MDDRLKQLLVLAREHYDKGELDKAEPVLREILDQTDRFADVYNMLGVALHQKGDFIQAERVFEKAVEINPAYTEALLNLAVTYNDIGKYEAARAVYSKVQRDDGGGMIMDTFARGKIANMHADLAQAYLDVGSREEAIAELRKATALCPTFTDLQTRLAALLREAGRMAQAREAYEAALLANPRYVTARIGLGVVLLATGHGDAAIEQWNEALALDPENATAKMYLRSAKASRGNLG